MRQVESAPPETIASSTGRPAGGAPCLRQWSATRDSRALVTGGRWSTGAMVMGAGTGSWALRVGRRRSPRGPCGSPARRSWWRCGPAGWSMITLIGSPVVASNWAATSALAGDAEGKSAPTSLAERRLSAGRSKTARPTTDRPGCSLEKVTSAGISFRQGLAPRGPEVQEHGPASEGRKSDRLAPVERRSAVTAEGPRGRSPLGVSRPALLSAHPGRRSQRTRAAAGEGQGAAHDPDDNNAASLVADERG